MIKKYLVVLLLALTSFSGESTLQPKSLCHFIGANAAEHHVAVDAGTGIQREDFVQTIKHFLVVAAPLVRAKGYKLVVMDKWMDTTVNSDTYVDEKSKRWIINAYGGLARSEGMTTDAYAMVMGHELMHHLGGAPKYPGPENWASVEGQSDYGAVKVFRRMAITGNLAHLQPSDVPEMIVKKCKLTLTTEWEQSVCERSAVAGLILADILRQLNGEPNPVSPNVKDASRVKVTYAGHPNGQCRYDTMVAGSACEVPYTVEFSDNDERIGSCNKGVGSRPRCWFAPTLPIKIPQPWV